MLRTAGRGTQPSRRGGPCHAALAWRVPVSCAAPWTDDMTFTGFLLDRLMPHLILAPIALPLLTAGLMLLSQAKQPGMPGTLGIYLPGNWPAPFGIVLALDRLSAMMLVLCSTVASATVLVSTSIMADRRSMTSTMPNGAGQLPGR